MLTLSKVTKSGMIYILQEMILSPILSIRNGRVYSHLIAILFITKETCLYPFHKDTFCISWSYLLHIFLNYNIINLSYGITYIVTSWLLLYLYGVLH